MVPKGTGGEETQPSPARKPSRTSTRFSLSPRSRLILLLAPAVLIACMLLGHWALRAIGVGAPKYVEVNLKALGNFTFDDEKGRTEDIPRRWRDLDSRRVGLPGFMLGPPEAGAGLQKYQLVYNVTSSSGFKRPPMVQERVYATAPASTPVFSQYDFVRVVGVLHVGVQRDQSGRVSSVFRMDVESATNAENETNDAPPRVEAWIALLISYLFLVAVVMVREWPWRDVQTRRATAGLCPSCGYDLRASKGRCPECGARISGGRFHLKHQTTPSSKSP
jgi:hypothetical protein